MTGKNSPRLFVLDTNVLMHDPTALFRFQEHDIFIPMVVLEELDASKKGMPEVSRNTRQASRFLIVTSYITETTSGLTYVVDRFKGWQYSGHITLRRGERSRLADFASEAL